MISKIRQWFKENFTSYSYSTWRESQNEYRRQMESGRVFDLAAFEYMLREDFPRHRILEVLRTYQTPADRREIESILRLLNGGELPPDCVECPIIDFPLTKETSNNEKDTNIDRVPEGTCTTL